MNRALIAFFVLIATSACGPKALRNPAGISYGPMDLTSAAVQDVGGCLNLQKVFEHLKKLPPQVKTRLVTVDFQFAGDTKPSTDERGERFTRYLANTLFELTESETGVFIETQPVVKQVGCQVLEIQRGDGAVARVPVVSAQKDEITYSFENRTRTLRVDGTRQLTLHRTSRVFDPCAGNVEYEAGVTQIVRWDEDEALQAAPEKISLAFAERILASIEVGFPGLEEAHEAIKKAQGSAEAEFTATSLRAMAGAPLALEIKKCPPPENP